MVLGKEFLKLLTKASGFENTEICVNFSSALFFV